MKMNSLCKSVRILSQLKNLKIRRKKFSVAAGLQILMVLTILFQTISAANSKDFSFKNDVTKNKSAENTSARKFSAILDLMFSKRGLKKEAVCDEQDSVAGRVLKEYGSIFIAHEKVSSPPVCVFTNHEEVENFQKSIEFTGVMLDGFYVELQTAALESLLAARAEARVKNLKITARDGAEAGRRTYADTLRLWKSRFDPACKYWKSRGRITDAQIVWLKSLPIKEQIKETLKLEKSGIFFSTKFNHSILQSVAPPGTSQHLSMLAFDINEYESAEIRRILAKHGWYRTIRNDVPHFTYLGHQENNLKNFGLRKIMTGDGEFWLANID